MGGQGRGGLWEGRPNTKDCFEKITWKPTTLEVSQNVS